ncbi:hypothetical protein AgCh_038894 [Apium graveolens]
MIDKYINDYSPEDISSIMKDSKVRHILHNSLDSVMSNKGIGCKTTKEIWDALEVKCQDPSILKTSQSFLRLPSSSHHFKEGYQTRPEPFVTPSRSGKFSTRYTVVVIGTPNPEVAEQQRGDVLLVIEDQIVDPIERPNAGPDEVDIEDVAVEDVVLEGIVAEEDPMEDPDKIG